MIIYYKISFPGKLLEDVYIDNLIQYQKCFKPNAGKILSNAYENIEFHMKPFHIEKRTEINNSNIIRHRRSITEIKQILFNNNKH